MEIYLLYAAVVAIGLGFGCLFAWLVQRDSEVSGRRGARRGAVRWGTVTEIRRHQRGARDRTHYRTIRARIIPVTSHQLTDLSRRYRVSNLIEDTVLIERS